MFAWTRTRFGARDPASRSFCSIGPSLPLAFALAPPPEVDAFGGITTARCSSPSPSREPEPRNEDEREEAAAVTFFDDAGLPLSHHHQTMEPSIVTRTFALDLQHAAIPYPLALTVNELSPSSVMLFVSTPPAAQSSMMKDTSVAMPVSRPPPRSEFPRERVN